MHGIVNLDKPKGLTSQQAVSRIKRMFKVKKAGHAGTLDPMATGVLLVCLGEATKISSLLMDMQKTYEAELYLGVRTDTLDAEGEIVEEQAVSEFTMEDINRVLESFKGVIKQTPPMYSALKRDGVPLYKLARQGKTVERKEREVNIYSIECTGYEHPYLRITVSCSKGTYIRTLAEDIAEGLGTIAHLSALRRTRVGEFDASDGFTMEQEGEINIDSEILADTVKPVDSAISALREVVLEPDDFKKASNGGFVDATRYSLPSEGGTLRLKDPEGHLFALASQRGERIKVDRMLHLNSQS